MDAQLGMLSGWLQKKGAVGIVRVYKRRYFRFTPGDQAGKLVYFESEIDKEPLGEIDVTGECEARLEKDSSSDLFDFQLATPTRVYLLRAESLEDLHYWMAGLTQYIKSLGPLDDGFSHVPAENNSSDYIVIDLHSSQLADAAAIASSVTDIDDDSQTDSDGSVLGLEQLEAFRRVHVIESAPRSAGLLGAAMMEDCSPLAKVFILRVVFFFFLFWKATRVISCLKTLLGPPPRADSGMGIGSVLRNLSPDQIEWLAPLLLALEKDDVTEVREWQCACVLFVFVLFCLLSSLSVLEMFLGCNFVLRSCRLSCIWRPRALLFFARR
jgi:hypothetical protein